MIIPGPSHTYSFQLDLSFVSLRLPTTVFVCMPVRGCLFVSLSLLFAMDDRVLPHRAGRGHDPLFTTYLTECSKSNLAVMFRS